MLSDAENEQGKAGSGSCTLVFLRMDGALVPGTENAQQLVSYVPPLEDA